MRARPDSGGVRMIDSIWTWLTEPSWSPLGVMIAYVLTEFLAGVIEGLREIREEREIRDRWREIREERRHSKD